MLISFYVALGFFAAPSYGTHVSRPSFWNHCFKNIPSEHSLFCVFLVFNFFQHTGLEMFCVTSCNETCKQRLALLTTLRIRGAHSPRRMQRQSLPSCTFSVSSRLLLVNNNLIFSLFDGSYSSGSHFQSCPQTLSNPFASERQYPPILRLLSMT